MKHVRNKYDSSDWSMTKTNEGYNINVILRYKCRTVMLYSKTVLGCKENRGYEMGVKKVVDRGKGIFLDTHRVSMIFRQPHTVLLLSYTLFHP